MSRAISLNVKITEGKDWPKPKNAKIPAKFHFSFGFLNGESEKTKVVNSNELQDLNIEKNYNVKAEDLLNLCINSNSDVFHLKFIKGEDDKNAVEYGFIDFNFNKFYSESLVIEDWYTFQLIEPENVPNEEIPKVKVRFEINEPLLLDKERENGNFLTIKLGPITKIPHGWCPKENQSVTDIPLDFIVIASIPTGNTFKNYFFRNGKVISLEDNQYGVSWEKDTQTFFLDNVAQHKLEQLSVNSEPLQFKMIRCIQREKFVDGWIDNNERKYRAKFEAPLRKLMEPGNTSFSTCSLLQQSPDEGDSVLDNRPKSANKRKKKTKDPAPPQLLPEGDEQTHPFEQMETSVNINVYIENPLIPKPENRMKPNLKPSELIPKRKKVEKKIDALEKYHEELSAVVDILVNEYKTLLRKDSNVDRDTFIFELNHSGKYFSFKERLKECVIQVVKEKFYFELKDKNENEIKIFYNDLYVFLTKQMHVALNRIFTNAKTEEKPPMTGIDGKPTDKWKRLADEAEVNENYALTAQYHQERIAHAEEEESPELKEILYEYGAFSMRVKDITKAEQAFRETLSIDMAHIPCLRLYSVLLLMKQQYKEAEVFLQAVVDVDPNDYISWGLLSLLFKKINNPKQEQQSLIYGESALEKQSNSRSSLKILVAKFLLSVHSDELAEDMLLEETEKTPEVLNALAKVYMIRENYEKVEEYLNDSIKILYKSMDTWEMMGEIHQKFGRFAEAEQALETALSVTDQHVDSEPNITLLLKLGSVYLKLHKYEKAKDTYLNAAKEWSSSICWLGVGISYYRLNDYRYAEQSLNEANIQNNKNPEVWAYLTLVSIKNNKQREAEKCIREAMS
ncbi:hypothetical protein ABK040_011616 [Willaertia magna]